MNDNLWGYRPFKIQHLGLNLPSSRIAYNIFLSDNFGMEIFIPKTKRVRGPYSKRDIKNIRTVWKLIFPKEYRRVILKYSKLRTINAAKAKSIRNKMVAHGK